MNIENITKEIEAAIESRLNDPLVGAYHKHYDYGLEDAKKDILKIIGLYMKVMESIIKERDKLAKRLMEIEEVSKDSNGKFYWRNSGKYVDGSGDLKSKDDDSL